jgi:hypothetical protein
MIPSTDSPRSKEQQGKRRGVGCTVAVTMGMRATVGGEIGEGVFKSRDLFVSSSVSSSSNLEKISLSGASLGGGDDPCAICSSLSNLSRLCLL